MSIEDAMNIACEEAKPWVGKGRVANYIPALARVPANQFGMAIVDVQGQTCTFGAAEQPFSIQSISKVFVLVEALRRYGHAVFENVGREPSGDPFNSIVQLEQEKGTPRNPFINAGAIATTSTVLGQGKPEDAIESILRFVRRRACDDRVGIDNEVAASEAATGSRNRSLAYFMRTYRTIGPVESVLQVYFHQCAIEMNCIQLAHAGSFLALDGKDPCNGDRVLSPMMTRQVNALMMTCGHYDASGDFAFRVGFPGKSGVGGGILAVVPGQASIAVWSPALSEQGNSLAGTKALEVLARETGWSVFRPNHPESPEFEA